MLKIIPDNFSEIESIQACYEKVRQYFDNNLKPRVFITILKNRENFNRAIGRKTPNWMVAFTQKNNIYILNPISFEKESSHKKEDFAKVLHHEIVHIFTNLINPAIMQWLDEGLALNLAFQKKRKLISKKNYVFFIDNLNILNNLPLDNFANHQGYIISYHLVKNLMKSFSKEQIIKLINIDKNNDKKNKEIELITGYKSNDFFRLLIKGVLVK